MAYGGKYLAEMEYNIHMFVLVCNQRNNNSHYVLVSLEKVFIFSRGAGSLPQSGQ